MSTYSIINFKRKCRFSQVKLKNGRAQRHKNLIHGGPMCLARNQTKMADTLCTALNNANTMKSHDLIHSNGFQAVSLYQIITEKGLIGLKEKHSSMRNFRKSKSTMNESTCLTKMQERLILQMKSRFTGRLSKSTTSHQRRNLC